MKLADWLKKNRITKRDFAGRVDAHESSVSYWSSGRVDKRPNWIYMERIAIATDGQVLPNDFLGENLAHLLP